MKEQLLTTKEAADYLRLTSKTLANLRSKGNSPKYLKMGNGQIRYTKTHLDEYIGINNIEGNNAVQPRSSN